MTSLDTSCGRLNRGGRTSSNASGMMIWMILTRRRRSCSSGFARNLTTQIRNQILSDSWRCGEEATPVLGIAVSHACPESNEIKQQIHPGSIAIVWLPSSNLNPCSCGLCDMLGGFIFVGRTRWLLLTGYHHHATPSTESTGVILSGRNCDSTHIVPLRDVGR